MTRKNFWKDVYSVIDDYNEIYLPLQLVQFHCDGIQLYFGLTGKPFRTFTCTTVPNR